MKMAKDLFNLAAQAEQKIEVPLIDKIHDVFHLAEAAAMKGQFSILIEFKDEDDEYRFCATLRSWGFNFIKIKDVPRPRVLTSWINLKLNKISLI